MLQSSECAVQREKLLRVYSTIKEEEYGKEGKFSDEVCQTMSTCHHLH